MSGLRTEHNSGGHGSDDDDENRDADDKGVENFGGHFWMIEDGRKR